MVKHDVGKREQAFRSCRLANEQEQGREEQVRQDQDGAEGVQQCVNLALLRCVSPLTRGGKSLFDRSVSPQLFRNLVPERRWKDVISDQPGVEILLGKKLIVKLVWLGHRGSFDHAAQMLQRRCSNEYGQVAFPRNVPHEGSAPELEGADARPLRVHALDAQPLSNDALGQNSRDQVLVLHSLASPLNYHVPEAIALDMSR